MFFRERKERYEVLSHIFLGKDRVWLGAGTIVQLKDKDVTETDSSGRVLPAIEISIVSRPKGQTLDWEMRHRTFFISEDIARQLLRPVRS